MRKLLAKFNINLPPMPTAPPSHTPSHQTLVQLAAIITVALVMHFSIASVMIASFSVAVFGLKCVILWKRLKSPSQWLMILLTILSIGLILMSYGGWSGQTAGISFLVLLVSLKFLESQTVRDYFVVCLILYFLAASSFLFNSSLPSILLVVAYTITITALLFKITNPAPINAISALKASSGLVLKAIPLALFLFFFFPRLQGDFGFLPSLDKGETSLENSLVAGEMASSAFSTELAFQAKFEGPIPPTSRLYWRAKVMNEEVNFAWQVSLSNLITPNNTRIAQQMREQAAPEPSDTKYEILHQSSSDLFLPYLDFVRSYSKGRVNYDYSVSVKRSDQGTFSYSGTSSLAPSFTTDEPALAPLIATESRPTARIQALLSEITDNYTSDAARANAVYEYFRNNEFSYSLLPPGLDEFTPLDDFLFNTRTGYCEHYASAFTTLLRWLKIPSRVVVGYQGGTVNRTGNFVAVSYSDAHAWSEAYINNTWVRYDPTAVISPERIEFGMDALRELWDNDLIGSNATGQALSDFLNPSGTTRAWRKMLESWSNVQYQWKKWVVDYDFETQQELLSKFGLSAKNSLTSLVLILSSGVFILLSLYFWQLLPKPKKRSELQKVYANYLKKIKKSGLLVEQSDTPNEVARRLLLTHPALKTQIASITSGYNELSYGPKKTDSRDRLSELNQAIRQLTIKRIKKPKK